MPQAHRELRDEAMHGVGIGTMNEMRSVVTGVFLPSFLSPVHTPGEKLALWRGKWSPQSTAMWNQLQTTDVRAAVPKLELPVYFLHGAFDHTVAYPMAKQYFDELQAPSKGVYSFQQSAHSPMFEEPELARRIFREDVLAGKHALADW